MFKVLFAWVLFAAAGLEAWGFALSTGPGYRQDRLDWKAGENREVFPHLRMFDWMLSFDVNAGPLHLAGEGDMGWFSGQAMRKSNADTFPAPVTFSCVASGRATTGSLYAGCRLGQKIFLTPLAGWLYDSASLHCSRPIPPFQRIAPLTDASIEFASNQKLTWQGPILGTECGWQPLKSLCLTGLYAYGWIRSSHSFSEIDTLRLAGSILEQTTLNESGSGWGGHGHLARFQMILFLSRAISFDMSARYLFLQSGAIQSNISKLSSVTLTAALDMRF